jgi:hypothetical protein
MHDARWSEGGIAGIQHGNILTKCEPRRALENEIKLILSTMGVGSMLLTRFERIQTDKKRLPLHDRLLPIVSDANFARLTTCFANISTGRLWMDAKRYLP